MYSPTGSSGEPENRYVQHVTDTYQFRPTGFAAKPILGSIDLSTP